MEVRKASANDIDSVIKIDNHISRETISMCISDGRFYILEIKGNICGGLRYGFLYDNLPFLNLIYLRSDIRGMGGGTALMDRWEDDMRKLGHEFVYTSTQADEGAQHFYRKRGYMDAGGFMLPGQVSLEIVLYKRLK